MEAAFFEPTESGLAPHADARSPWSDDMMHGRLLAGLLAWAIEREHGDAAFVPTRLTVDLFRNPSMEPVVVETSVTRAGGRVRAIDAIARISGRDVARASSLHLRRGTAPDDDVPVSQPLPHVEPETLGAGALPGVPFDVQSPEGRGFAGTWPRQAWLRDRRPLVRGTELTPFIRAALAADFASPLANSGSQGLDYINADLSLHLGRLPDGEWIGVETADRVAADGVSVAYCRFHDHRGPVGWSTVCAVVNARMTPPGEAQRGAP